MSTIDVRCWGVRGSIPCPGPQTQKYGGNSACIELRFGDEQKLVIVDAGSGIRELGKYLLTNDLPKGVLDIALFLTHTHWDHIMGFPYFAPIYIPGTQLKVFGPVTFEDDSLEEMVGGQMKYRYFPVNIGELSSEIEYVHLTETTGIDLGDGLTVATKLLNHPIISLGYRFEYAGRKVCTCYDTEPFRNRYITDPEHPGYDEAMAYDGEQAARAQNEILEQFYQGADLLIHDCQYTMAEYQQKFIGWGHSPIEYVIEAANRAGVKKLLLFHHDPDRSDNELDRMAKEYCEPGRFGDTEIAIAMEGRLITV